MLKKILSISGRPGLYKLLSYGKNVVIVESLVDGKRGTASARDKLISLGDIAIYTTADDVPLAQVFENVYKKFDGKPLDLKKYQSPEQLVAFFGEVLPDFDEERVYKNDIKKVASWYNILVNAGFTEFTTKEEETEEKADDKAETEVKKDDVKKEDVKKTAKKTKKEA